MMMILRCLLFMSLLLIALDVNMNGAIAQTVMQMVSW